MTVELDAQGRADAIRLGLDSLGSLMSKVPNLVIEAHQLGDYKALGYESWKDYIQAEFGTKLLKLDKAVRQVWVKELTDAGLTEREIAPVVNASQKTVDRDRHEAESLESNDSAESPEPEADTKKADDIKAKVETARAKLDDAKKAKKAAVTDVTGAGKAEKDRVRAEAEAKITEAKAGLDAIKAEKAEAKAEDDKAKAERAAKREADAFLHKLVSADELVSELAEAAIPDGVSNQDAESRVLLLSDHVAKLQERVKAAA